MKTQLTFATIVLALLVGIHAHAEERQHLGDSRKLASLRDQSISVEILAPLTIPEFSLEFFTVPDSKGRNVAHPVRDVYVQDGRFGRLHTIDANRPYCALRPSLKVRNRGLDIELNKGREITTSSVFHSGSFSYYKTKQDPIFEDLWCSGSDLSVADVSRAFGGKARVRLTNPEIQPIPLGEFFRTMVTGAAFVTSERSVSDRREPANHAEANASSERTQSAARSAGTAR